MGALVDSVGDILSRVERHVEASSQNISNATTPGYKRAVSFEQMLEASATGPGSDDAGGAFGVQTRPGLAIDMSAGPPINTNNSNDLAILGAGFFAVRASGGEVLYTRQGQFERDGAGHLVTAQGGIVQQSGGGDLVLGAGDFKVLPDGTVIQSAEAVGRIAIVALTDPTALHYADGGLYSAPAATVVAVNDPTVSQGMLEASNVSLGAEMISIMAALREAQSGQRLMSVYDDLMGRAISTFGQV